MAAPDTRVGERSPTAMRIKLRYPDIDTFIQKYAVNISRGGIFIATKAPKPVGTLLKFEFVLAQTEPGTSIIRGEGQVQWTREFDAAQPSKAHGMGVKFTRLDTESQAVVDRALAWRAAQSDGEGDTRNPTGVATGSFAQVKTPPPSGDAGDVPTAVRPLQRVKPPEPATAVVTLPSEELLAAARLVPPVAPPAVFDAPTPVRTLRNDGTLAPPAEVPERTTIYVPPQANDTQLDELAASWGLSNERVLRTLNAPRATIASPEAALAELEALVAKPAPAAPLAPDQALAELRRLLD